MNTLMQKKNSLENKKAKELDTINSMKQKIKKSKKRSKGKDWSETVRFSTKPLNKNDLRVWSKHSAA